MIITIFRLCRRPAGKMSNAPVRVLIQLLVLGETEKLLVLCRYISFNFMGGGGGWSGLEGGNSL